MQPQKTLVEGRAGARPGQRVLKVQGSIKFENVEPFREAVSSVEEPNLILDLTEVPYIDSSAIGALVHAYVSCRKSGRKLALVGLSDRVRSVLHLANVDVLFTTFDSLSQAEEALV
jgi:anti-sigma B factor antagonist